jgi:hypothetical protein
MHLRSLLSEGGAPASSSASALPIATDSQHRGDANLYNSKDFNSKEHSLSSKKRVRSAAIRQQGKEEDLTHKMMLINCFTEYGAYSAVLSAFWAQGELNWSKESFLVDLRHALHIDEYELYI